MTTERYLPLLKTLSLTSLLLVASVASAGGSADKGADVYAENCADCHSVVAGKNKKGPSLFGVLGRKSATLEGFSNYSQQMHDSGIEWTAEQLDAYIANPGKAVAGGKMKFDGLNDAGDRSDLIAYLSTLR